MIASYCITTDDSRVDLSAEEQVEQLRAEVEQLRAENDKLRRDRDIFRQRWKSAVS